MRYEKGRKDATRQRIVEVASKQFRGGGLAATGIASVMSEAGLTNGAFYPHFSSKDDLITKTLAAELAKQNERQKQFVGTDEGLEGAIRSYLRRGHRENAEGGCPSAALLPEIARAPRETRQAYQDGLAAIIDTLARHFPDDTEDEFETQGDSNLRVARGNDADRQSYTERCAGTEGSRRRSRRGTNAKPCTARSDCKTPAKASALTRLSEQFEPHLPNPE